MSIHNKNQQDMNTEDIGMQELDTQEIDAQAKQIAGLLDAHANRLSMRTLKQLENGRERALKAHAVQLAGHSLNADGTLNHTGSWFANHRLAVTGFAMAAVICSVVVLKSLNNNESSDAFLLSADLPPEAFVDKGFEPSLNVAAVQLQQKVR